MKQNNPMWGKNNTVPKEIDFPQYNMKCSGENVLLSGIFHVLSCFPLHLMLYRGNLDYLSNSARDRWRVQCRLLAGSASSRA